MLRTAVSCAALASGALFLSSLATPSAAQAATPAASVCAPGAVATHHRARIGGRSLAYVACVGSLPVRNLAGETTAQITYTAYIVSGRKRGVSFVWNGGPGADSHTLQFHALGPRLLRDGHMLDNPASPLATSDLVFVDPVGTGFSTADSPEDAKAYFGTLADIASVTGFVVDWRRAYGREHSALQLVGESFGTWRASGVAEALADKGIAVSGVALISGGIPLGEVAHPELHRAVSLVNRAASAFALGRLAPDLMQDRARTLAEVRQWAETVYAPALADPAALSTAQRARVIAQAARYQGLRPEDVDARTLWVWPRAFRQALVPGATLNVFDMRSTTAFDDSAESGEVLAYYRKELGYTAGHYAGADAPPSPAGKDWQYDQAPVTPTSLARALAGEGPPSASQPWILRAMEKEPALRTFVAAGLYDSLNSCLGNALTVARLPRAVSTRFTLRCYEGGHMMYDDPTQTERFGRDLTQFLSGKDS